MPFFLRRDFPLSILRILRTFLRVLRGYIFERTTG